MRQRVFYICLALILIGSACEKQLKQAEAARLTWVRTLPENGTDALGWIYSFSLVGLACTAAFGVYGLHLRVQYQHDFNEVVTDDYEAATYKMISNAEYQEYKKQSIPKSVKDEVVARDGMRCKYTGKKLYLEPPGKLSNWVWKKTNWVWEDTKKSKDALLAIKIGAIVLNKLADHQMLEYGHIIPRRIKGKNTAENIVLESRSHNRRTNRYLYGKKKRLALIKLKEWNETIHKDCL